MSYQNADVQAITTNENPGQPVPEKRSLFAAFTEDIWAVTIGGSPTW